MCRTAGGARREMGAIYSEKENQRKVRRNFLQMENQDGGTHVKKFLDV
jgi:hypothetical protein